MLVFPLELSTTTFFEICNLRNLQKKTKKAHLSRVFVCEIPQTFAILSFSILSKDFPFTFQRIKF